MSVHEEGLRDVVVVGGGAAGLSAALTLSRARQAVTVIDAGAPRNAPAEGVHGLLGLEGISPVELLRRGREEVRGYGGEIVTGEVVDVERTATGFTLRTRNGASFGARRLVIATGLVDELPEVPGVREQWGRGVLHCPFCHGWEVRDRRIGILVTGPQSVHKAFLFRQWSADVVLFSNDHELEPQEQSQLAALGVAVIDGTVTGLDVEGDALRGVRLADGRAIDVDAIVVATRMVARTEPFEGIGLEPTEHPMGAFIEADEFGRSTVPGVWVAGNASDLGAQVSHAVAAGTRAAQHLISEVVMAGLAPIDAPVPASSEPAQEGA
ncbi:NAD(P)/FAD-dependent oxidoreductase [Ornithinimicrobium murale]|uniref:NAD(P)/FAD-dependent oxidoreductase n=1 Tax=Ornithinimicrobium murale TaxID=1050153 RepID=UPI000E0CD7EE|nr:NAD(P)/FAD-dependent oxidoreductase [Ornithinimicrobium murale]